MNEAKVQKLIDAGEGQEIEFKQSLAEDRAAIEALGAFANAEGGTVVFGVSPLSSVVGVGIGANSLERLANEIREHTDPVLYPRIDHLMIGGRAVVTVTIKPLRESGVAYAYNKAFIRVGRTNQPMASKEQTRRHQTLAAANSGRPEFAVDMAGGNRREDRFEPSVRVKHTNGDVPADIQWRFRGPRFGGATPEWRQAEGSALARTSFMDLFDLRSMKFADERVGVDEIGFEIRVAWQEAWCHELHRWPITSRTLPQKVLWEPKDKILPVERWKAPLTSG